MASSRANFNFTFTFTKYLSQNVRSGVKLREMEVDPKYESNIKTDLKFEIGFKCLRILNS